MNKGVLHRSGVARGSAARGGSRNCRRQMQWCTQDLAERGGNIIGGLGAKPPAAKEFLRFSHKKNTFFNRLLYRKRACSESSHP